MTLISPTPSDFSHLAACAAEELGRRAIGLPCFMEATKSLGVCLTKSSAALREGEQSTNSGSLMLSAVRRAYSSEMGNATTSEVRMFTAKQGALLVEAALIFAPEKDIDKLLELQSFSNRLHFALDEIAAQPNPARKAAPALA